MAFTGFKEAVVLDTETTGLSPDRDRIVSLALYKADFSNLRHNPKMLVREMEKEYVFNPGQPIPKEASKVHGIFDRDVVGKPSFGEKSKEIREFIGRLPIIGHNVSFDKSMLNSEFKRAGEKTLHGTRTYCTMKRFQNYNDGLWKGSTLGNATRWFGLPVGKCHNAMDDTRKAARLAAVFYMVDNKIKFPGGFREAPSSKDEWFAFIREASNGLQSGHSQPYTQVELGGLKDILLQRVKVIMIWLSLAIISWLFFK